MNKPKCISSHFFLHWLRFHPFRTSIIVFNAIEANEPCLTKENEVLGSRCNRFSWKISPRQFGRGQLKVFLVGWRTSSGPFVLLSCLRKPIGNVSSSQLVPVRVSCSEFGTRLDQGCGSLTGLPEFRLMRAYQIIPLVTRTRFATPSLREMNDELSSPPTRCINIVFLFFSEFF